MRKSALTLVLPVALLIAAANGAWAGEWLVGQVSGEAWIGAAGIQPVSLGRNATLPDGGIVLTGDDGRVLLQRGQERIVVGPNSAITVPADDAQGYTTILQRAGVVEFNVEKRNVQHFEVETPYLAAVVKGTRFAVGVFAGSGVVKVARGRVEVSDPATGEFVDVLPGQEAMVKPGRGLSVAGEGQPQPVRQGEPSQGLGLGRGLGIGDTVSAAMRGVGVAGLGLDGVGTNGLGIGAGGLGLGIGVGGVGIGLGGGNGNGNGGSGP